MTKLNIYMKLAQRSIINIYKQLNVYKSIEYIPKYLLYFI